MVGAHGVVRGCEGRTDRWKSGMPGRCEGWCLGGGWCMVIMWICRGVCAWKHPSLQAPTRGLGSLMG